MSLMVDAASGLCAAVELGGFTEVAGAALPGGRVVLWNIKKPIPRDQRKSDSWCDSHDTVTQVLHLGEGLDAAGRPRRVTEGGAAYPRPRLDAVGVIMCMGTGLAVAGRAVCLGGDLIFGDTGLSTVQVFDERRGAWFQGPRMPEAHVRPKAAEHGGCALAVLSDALWRYDPRAPAWASVAPLTAPVPSSAAAAAVGDRLLVIGGDSAAVRCFDMRAGRWEEAGAAGAPPPLPQPKSHFSAVTVGSEVWCVGGTADDEVDEEDEEDEQREEGFSRGIEIYSAHTNTWRRGGRLPEKFSFDVGSGNQQEEGPLGHPGFAVCAAMGV
jgi:hypothetical protein